MTVCTTADQFGTACAAWLDGEVLPVAVLAAKLLAKDSYANLVQIAPVWTGRFLGSITLSLGQPKAALPPVASAVASGAVHWPQVPGTPSLPLQPQEIDALLAAMRPGDMIFLADAVPYAQKLDQGSSPQAPANFWEMAAAQAVADLAKANWTALARDCSTPL